MFVQQTEGTPFLVYMASVILFVSVVLAVLELAIWDHASFELTEILLPLPSQSWELKVCEPP